VDDDDIALPTALEAMTRALSGRPDIGFSYGRYQHFSVDAATGDRQIRDCGYWPDVEDELFFRANLEDFFAHHPGLLVRRAAYDAVGPFSPNYGRSEDYEMLIRLADRFDCRKTPELVFLQRQHDGQRFGGLAGDRRMERWILEQAEMFKVVRDRLPLTSYLPRNSRAQGLSPERHREALIVRGSIMARKKLWGGAFEDFHAAGAVEGAALPLNATERDVLRRALFSKYGTPEVPADPDIKRRLRQLANTGQVGLAITRALARSLAWFIRRSAQAGRLRDASRYTALALSLSVAGIVGGDDTRPSGLRLAPKT
jgi:hypothetical protein